jgi:HEAT repeat protein
MTSRCLAPLFATVLLFVPAAGAQHPESSDERLLRDARQATDDASLLDFFRKRTLDQAGQTRVQTLVRQLGDNSFRAREDACTELIRLGLVAVPFLRQAVKSPDIEVVRRAEECLRHIEEKDSRVGLPVAAARLLEARKPAGAAEVLINFLPFAENDAVTEEVEAALGAVAVRDGKPDASLTAALHDPLPVKRAVAAEVLCRAGAAEQRAEVRKLLHDPDLNVRLRAAVALASHKERDAIPVLIDLLAELPQEKGWQAEDVLLRLAAGQAPQATLGRDQAARRQCRDAWAAWWRAHAGEADLARLEGGGRLLGYTLIVLLNAGQVLELGPDNKPRLQIDGLSLPLDVQILPDDHILAAEHNANRVTERDRRGQVVWEKRVQSPIVAQRLPNGNTFIATQDQLLEVDKNGQEVFSYARPDGNSFMKAQKLPNGEIACVVFQPRKFLRLDAKGRELQSFPVNVATFGGRIDVLPGGRVLVPEKNNDRVVEYDAQGKVLWQVSFQQPVAAVRLPNGNTLVTSFNQNRAVELDRSGKEVWEYRAETRVTRAFRR